MVTGVAALMGLVQQDPLLLLVQPWTGRLREVRRLDPLPLDEWRLWL